MDSHRAWSTLTDETSTEGTTPSAAPAGTARRTRGRRVVATGVATPPSSTAPAAPAAVPPAEAPPAAAPPSDVAPGSTEPAADVPAAADEAPAPKTRARRTTRTRATAPGTTPPVEQAADDAARPAAAEDAAVISPEPATSAPRARRSRRATSAGTAEAAATQAPTAPVTDQPDQPAETAESVPAEPAQPAEPAPARGGRRRASRSAGAGEAAAGDAGASTEAAPAGEVPAAPALDVLAELGAATTAPAAPPRGRRESPRLATTALLFQAPEPSARPKRRRVQAPAGPPVLEDVVLPADEEPEDEELAVEAGLALPEDESAGVAGTDEDAPRGEPDEDEEAGGPRRRRRRGGRGRRSRSGAERDTEDAVDAPDGAEDASAEDADRPAGAEEDQPEAGRRRRRPGRGRAADADASAEDEAEPDEDEAAEDEADEAEEQGENEPGGTSSRRRRRRRRSRGEGDDVAAPTRTRTRAARPVSDEVTALKGSTRLEAKRQRRREGRDAGRRRTIVTESEFLARREAVDRAMVVRESDGRVQIAVLEDGVLVEHFVSRTSNGQNQTSMAGNVYLGRVQNVLPSMEAAFVDVGKGRNAVLYAGEVNWDAAGLEGQPRRIEQALKSGDSVLVQVTKDPIGHKGARLTSQITLAGRYLVYVPAGGMTGISRKLPENERARLKKLLKEIVPDAAGVIVRTAAEGASEEELRNDVQRLQDQWAAIEKKAKSASAPALLQGEPDLAIRVVRDIFNDDFSSLVVQGDGVWSMISEYVGAMAPDLVEKVSRWTGQGDVFGAHRIDEQLAKGMDRKVYLPSGGSLVIDRTEAMTVVDVNTGKFTGSGGTLEETVTRNNLEAAEEIVRQLRLRDIGGIIVIDFIDMVLESNRDLVLRRLVECLGRDRTKHQVAEVTSLGLVQMTRKRVGQGLVEAFSETCQHCNGRGFIVHAEPVEVRSAPEESRPAEPAESKRSRRKKAVSTPSVAVPVLPEAREAVKATLATIAAAAAHAHEHEHEHEHEHARVAQAHDGRAGDAHDGGTDDVETDGTQDAAQDDLGDALQSIHAVEAPVAPVAEGEPLEGPQERQGDADADADGAPSDGGSVDGPDSGEGPRTAEAEDDAETAPTDADS